MSTIREQLAELRQKFIGSAACASGLYGRQYKAVIDPGCGTLDATPDEVAELNRQATVPGHCVSQSDQSRKRTFYLDDVLADVAGQPIAVGVRRIELLLHPGERLRRPTDTERTSAAGLDAYIYVHPSHVKLLQG